jgi:hypothetical protein
MQRFSVEMCGPMGWGSSDLYVYMMETFVNAIAFSDASYND